ncbi:MAG: hypothetical protein WDN04_19465 [Rhodospirillales bacterium]
MRDDARGQVAGLELFTEFRGGGLRQFAPQIAVRCHGAVHDVRNRLFLQQADIRLFP